MPSERTAAVPDAADLAGARSGDDAAFTRLVQPLRSELHAHCYRMLGSVHDADDALQDALVRAWRGLARFEGRSSLRRWLYQVATHTCLDTVRSRGRRALPVDLGPSSARAVVDNPTLTDVAWLGPYPDTDVAVELRESVELAFVAALQHLPGNQRAALVLFEVVGFSVAEIAELMDTSTASVNSALQRARAVVATRVPDRSQQQTLRTVGEARVREIAGTFATALEQGDSEALVALLTEDVTWSMPPMPHWYQGIDAVRDFAVEVPLGSCPGWRHLPTHVNAQPAVACYLLDPDGAYLPWSINTFTLRDDKIAEITSFVDVDFARFDLPTSMPP